MLTHLGWIGQKTHIYHSGDRIQQITFLSFAHELVKFKNKNRRLNMMICWSKIGCSLCVYVFVNLCMFVLCVLYVYICVYMCLFVCLHVFVCACGFECVVLCLIVYVCMCVCVCEGNTKEVMTIRTNFKQKNQKSSFLPQLKSNSMEFYILYLCFLSRWRVGMCCGGPYAPLPTPCSRLR